MPNVICRGFGAKFIGILAVHNPLLNKRMLLKVIINIMAFVSADIKFSSECSVNYSNIAWEFFILQL